MCDICNGESGGRDLGVASLTSGAMSVMFCDNCLTHCAEPQFALDYLFIHVASGDRSSLVPNLPMTWVDGHYETFDEYITRLSPEYVKHELEEYEKAMEGR